MIKKALLAGLILPGLLLLAASSLEAQPHRKKADPGEGKSMMMEKRMNRAPGMRCMNPMMMKTHLGLSDDQAGKIDAIRLDYSKKILEYREKAAPKKIAVRRLLLEDNVDITRIRSLVKELGDLNVEMRMLKIQEHLDTDKVLTPAQRTKWRAMKAEKCRSDCPMGRGRKM